MFGNFGIGEILVLLIFLVLPIALWLIALIDILKSNFSGNNKVVWIIVVILLPILGAILYLLIGRSQKVK
jgi:hypothetical protein